MNTTDQLKRIIAALGNDFDIPRSPAVWRECSANLEQLAATADINPGLQSSARHAASDLGSGPMTKDALIDLLADLSRHAEFPNGVPSPDQEQVFEPAAAQTLAGLLREDLDSLVEELDIYYRPDLVEVEALTDFANRLRSLLGSLNFLHLRVSEQIIDDITQLPSTLVALERRGIAFRLAVGLRELVAQLDRLIQSPEQSGEAPDSIPHPAEIHQARAALNTVLAMEPPDAAQQRFLN